MAKTRVPINVEAYVTVGGREVCVDTLTPDQKAELSEWLRMTWLGELYRGKAVFRTGGERKQ